MDQTEKLILEAIDQHRDEIIEFARDIYDHGELGYKEFNTAEKFIKKMRSLNLPEIYTIMENLDIKNSIQQKNS